MICYNNGREFFYDLLACFGVVDGIRMAKDYLDMQIRNTNPSELDFCRDLYNTMIAYENRKKASTSRPA